MVSRAVPTANDEPAADDLPEYPDSLDAGLLRIAGVCILASVMAILDGTVVSVAQRTFIAEFASTQAVVAWTITGYTLGQATVIPLAGWASDRFGTKRLFMGAALWFTLASLLCSMASNITQLIAFRVIQGFGGGMLVPLTLIILTREAGPRRLGRLMAVLGIPMLLAPMCGPVLGGWLISAYGWQWIFRINLPVGGILIVLAALQLPRESCVDTGAHRNRFDHGVCSARAAPRRPPAHRLGAVQESGGDAVQLRDVHVLRWIFRRRPGHSQLSPAAAA